MSTAKDLKLADIGKLVLVAGVSVGINHLLSLWLNKKAKSDKGHPTPANIPNIKIRRLTSMK